MNPPKPAVDLEKELTCSICTELLYQPLTLLDCLHTFCGACLKEWFSWQAVAAEHAPTPPEPGSPVFTCPSCRASVRDTKHNATVVTLLDMYLAVNPDKTKPDEEKAEMNSKYKPGDKVLPKLNIRERTPQQRRLDEQERRLIEEVRQLSLNEAVAEASSNAPRSRRRGESRSRDSRSGRSRDPSREPDREPGARDARDRARRNVAEEETRRRRTEQRARLQPDGRSRDDGRQRRSESGQRSAESSETRRRPIEHQSSLRSLIGTSEMDPTEIEREIEEFARQIQEEGLLEGLDLDNIDLDNNDELSRRITEAYRRRQRQRSRQEVTTAASNARSNSPRPDPAAPETRPQHLGNLPVTASRHGTHARSSSATDHTGERMRPPATSGPANHLGVQEEPRRRRRTASAGRSATVPVAPSQPETRAASRSQTDLSIRTHGGETAAGATAGRPNIAMEGRSSSTPTISASAQPTPDSATHTVSLPFRARAETVGLGIIQSQSQHQAPPTATPAPAPAPEVDPERKSKAARPADLTVGPIAEANFAQVGGSVSPSLSTPPLLSSPGANRVRLPRYPEPSITCSRCERPHIEYDLHYNCAVCHGGNWNTCLDCYRRGKGCLHWFGFGYGAWAKWEQARRSYAGRLPEPHMLTANRYLRPRATPGGAEGRQTLTTQNPDERLESGTFCSRCFAWTIDCYWRCDVCNEGEWGYCNDCVNQGRCCTHLLLPLAYSPTTQTQRGGSGSESNTPPASPSPRSPGASRPRTASILTGPDVTPIGPFRPLTFANRCDVCQIAIAPTQNRFHCYTCPSSLLPDSRPGDYEICQACYTRLVAEKRISAENGPGGWRRCSQGHRMAVVGFLDLKGGYRRYVAQDWVGGRMLQFEHYDGAPGLHLCYWFEGADKKRVERLVTADVRATAATAVVADPAVKARLTDKFPPDGGAGGKALAKWSWYPAPSSEDELLFPKGAEIREIEDVNGEWFHGVFMGAKGLFPAPYVMMEMNGETNTSQG